MTPEQESRKRNFLYILLAVDLIGFILLGIGLYFK